MTDVIVSADTVTRPVAPPTVQVELPAPSAPADEMLPQYGCDVVLKRINGPIDSGTDGSGLRQALQRERQAEPLVEWSGKNMPIPGEHESTGKQLRKASE